MWREIAQQPGFRDKLHDPAIAEWFLESLKTLDETGESQLKAEWVTWFDEDVLRSLLAKPHWDILHIHLFREVPASQFAGVKDVLLESFKSWKSSLQSSALPVLAAVDPEVAIQFLRDRKVEQSHHAFGFSRALQKLEPDLQKELLPGFLESLLKADRVDFNRAALGDSLALAYSLSLPELQGLLVKRMRRLTEYDLPWVNTLYRALSSERSFFTHFRDYHEYDEVPLPSALAWLFRKDAPLREMDQLVKQKKGRWESILQTLQQNQRSWPDARLAFFLQVADQLDKKITAASKTIFGDFLLALQLSVWLLDTWSFESLTMDEILYRLSTDLKELPCLQELVQSLKDFPADSIREPLTTLLYDNYDVYSAIHLAQTMGMLTDPAYVEPLIGCLTEDSGEYLCEAAAEALVHIGEDAVRHLTQSWDSLDYSQKIYGMGVLRTIASSHIVEFLIERIEELNEDRHNLEQWCSAAQRNPDRRLIKCLEPELGYDLPIIRETFYQLCVLLDYAHPRLDEVQQQVEEDQRRLSQVSDGALENFESMTDFVSDFIKLELRCQYCGKSRVYNVSHVYISVEGDQEPYIGGDLYCKACGELAEFELTNMSRVALMAEMLKIKHCKEEGEPYEGPLQIATFVIHGGIAMSPRQALQHYQKQVQNNPKDMVAWLSLGNLYEGFHQHQKASLCFQKCAELDPNSPEATFYAAIYIDEKEDSPREAWELMTQCLAHHKEWTFYRLESISEREFVEEYLEFYDTLCSRLSLPNQYTDISLAQFSSYKPTPKVVRSASASSLQEPVVKEKKVGRNDPCPCGSGKKYKKCCMRKE